MLFLLVLCLARASLAAIVQSLSSRVALVLGGYGPGYSELRAVEVP